jgi:hypothetical protein
MARSRSLGAARWATVLSELAEVPVVVEWESPSWRVRWLVHGSHGSAAAEYDVDRWFADTAYPQRRAGAELRAAALVLAAVSRGDVAALGALMTSARPPLPPAALPGPVIRAPGSGGQLLLAGPERSTVVSVAAAGSTCGRLAYASTGTGASACCCRNVCTGAVTCCRLGWPPVGVGPRSTAVTVAGSRRTVHGPARRPRPPLRNRRGVS